MNNHEQIKRDAEAYLGAEPSLARGEIVCRAYLALLTELEQLKEQLKQERHRAVKAETELIGNTRSHGRDDH